MLQSWYDRESELAKGLKGAMEENSQKQYVLWKTAERWGGTED